MKKVSKIILVLIVLVLSFSTVIVMEKTNYDVSESTPPVIKFPEYGGKHPEVKYIDLINYDKIENENIINQYYILNRKEDEDVINSVKEILKLDSFDIENNDGTTLYENTDRIAEIYDDGTITYLKLNTDNKTMNISDSDCIKLASDFIKNVNMDKNYKDYEVGETRLININTGETTVIEKTVYLYRYQDNVSIKGNAPSFITYDSKGEITELYISSNEIGNKVTYNSRVTYEEAVDRAMNYEGKVDIPDDCDTVELKSIKIVYWEDSTLGSENNTIQPVYEINGIAYKNGDRVGEYTAYESALR